MEKLLPLIAVPQPQEEREPKERDHLNPRAQKREGDPCGSGDRHQPRGAPRTSGNGRQKKCACNHRGKQQNDA